jgi:cytochrome c oxidase subunit 1
MPRRMAYFDFTNPALAPEALSVIISVIGGIVLLASGLLFLVILFRGQMAPHIDPAPYRFSVAVHPPVAVPAALNSYVLWVALMIALTVTNYGFPIATLAARQDTSVPAVYVGWHR